jgi:hypothetical protein
MAALAASQDVTAIMPNESKRKIEITLSGDAVQDGKVSVSLFTRALQSIQEILYQVADAQARREPKSAKIKPSIVRRECELFLVDVAPGSVHATLSLPEREMSLFPDYPEFCEIAMAQTGGALVAVAENDDVKLKTVLPDPEVRRRVIDKIQRIAPGKDSDYALSFRLDKGPSRTLLRPSPEFVARLEDRPPSPPEVREPDVRFVEAKGMAQVKNGNIKKWVETFEISELDVNPEHVWRSRMLKAKGRVFHLSHPVACVIEKQENLFFSEDDFLGIVAHGDSREEVIRGFSDEFATIWDGIAQEEDHNLTHDAQLLKKKLLELVRKVEPHGDPEIAGDQRGSD